MKSHHRQEKSNIDAIQAIQQISTKSAETFNEYLEQNKDAIREQLPSSYHLCNESNDAKTEFNGFIHNFEHSGKIQMNLWSPFTILWALINPHWHFDSSGNFLQNLINGCTDNESKMLSNFIAIPSLIHISDHAIRTIPAIEIITNTISEWSISSGYTSFALAYNDFVYNVARPQFIFTERKYLHSDADIAQVKVKSKIPFLRVVSGVFYHLCFVKLHIVSQ